MNDRNRQFDDYVLKIHAALDRLDYYRLLGVKKESDEREIKKAFYAIAKKFHPDRNRDAGEQVMKAIYDIYKRINEAYGVLLDQDRRKYYDKLLEKGNLRLDRDVRGTMIPTRPGDTIQSREARHFFEKAKEALERGDLMQADLHIKVAVGHEMANEEILRLFGDIREAKLKKQKGVS